MAVKYRYQARLDSINACVVDVAKVESGEILGIQSFRLRIHPVPEGQDPVAVAIAKHRDQLRW